MLVKLNYKTAKLMFNSIRVTGPPYFKDFCVPLSTMPGRSSLPQLTEATCAETWICTRWGEPGGQWI